MSKWREAAEKYLDNMPDNEYPPADLAAERAFQAGAEHGHQKGLEEAIVLCRRQREAYHEDIFPDYTLAQNPAPSIDAVAGKMARFICDVLANDIESLKERSKE